MGTCLSLTQIEAASFLHFLEQDALISYEDVQALLVVDGLQCVYVTPMRYLLGLSDLTGELMRYAINAIASHNPLAKIERVLQMQYTIYSGTLQRLTQRSSRWPPPQESSAKSNKLRFPQFAKWKTVCSLS